MGTLLSGCFAWLDARCVGAKFVLRMEDLDGPRCQPRYTAAILKALESMGIDWDVYEKQSEQISRYENAMDVLAKAGKLYDCQCSRSQIRERAMPALGGGYIYPGTCQSHVVIDWRQHRGAIRYRVPEGFIDIKSEYGDVLSQSPSQAMGDPVVRRKDGQFSYQLAVVVDDMARGITRVVRGRDIAPSTAVQVCLLKDLGGTVPQYFHHYLLLDKDNETKLSKSAGPSTSVPSAMIEVQRQVLAMIGNAVDPDNIDSIATLKDVLAKFSWDLLPNTDVIIG